MVKGCIKEDGGRVIVHVIKMAKVFDIIIKPLSTEKVMRLIDGQNTLCFIVNKGATKPEIKKAVEDYFNVKVSKVNVHIDRDGHKRAYVQLNREFVAMDIATQLGLM